MRLHPFRRLPGKGLFGKFLLILSAAFLTFCGVGAWIVGRAEDEAKSLELAARVGNAAARVASAATRHDPRGDHGLVQVFLAPLATDPAVDCAEVTLADSRKRVAALPPGLGCTGQPGADRIVLEVGEPPEAELLVLFNEGELVRSERLLRDLTALAVALSFAGAALSAAIGFRLIVGRPLDRLRRAIQSVGDTGERQPVTVRGDDELSEVMRAYNRMLEREFEREQALARSRDALAESRQALVEANRALEQRVQERTEALEAALRRAEASSEAKSRFLANMSHELRTPMNGVLGLCDLLLTTPLDTRQRTHLDDIRTSAEALLAIIADVLDFSRLEAGRVRLQNAPMDLIEVTRAVVSALTPLAADKGIGLVLDARTWPGGWRVGDGGRVRQILLNLVGNAIKFTPQGEVRIVLSADVGDACADAVSLTVIDTGTGVPEAARPTLFERFSQAEDSASRRFGGAGLGLAISRELAQLMGGDLAYQPREECGSVFTCTLCLPLAAASGDLAAPITQGAAEGTARRFHGHVLVADDNAINRRVAAGLLASFGLEVRMACDGAEAVRQHTEHGFDLILMDCQMPGMDGYEATAKLRAVETRRTPVVAVTANAMPEDRARCLEAGMDDYLPKPVSRASLESVLTRWLPAP